MCSISLSEERYPFAYVKFKYPNESFKAIKLLNNQNFNGSNIIVKHFIPLDERINPSHTFVYKETPYWDTHCLNKDVNCIAYTKDMELLKSVCEFNEKQKTKNDKYWEDKLNSLK